MATFQSYKHWYLCNLVFCVETKLIKTTLIMFNIISFFQLSVIGCVQEYNGISEIFYDKSINVGHSWLLLGPTTRVVVWMLIKK